MPEKKKFISKEDQKNLALVTAGSSIGCVTPFVLREYIDGYTPEGIWPGVIPIEWGRPSVIGSIGLGVTCLIGGIVSKSLRLFLLPLGITSTSVGILMGVFPTPPSSAIRLLQTSPAGTRLKNASPGQIRLVQAGNPGHTSNPGSNFTQQNPQARLLQLQKESADIEAQKEVKKLEEELKFRRNQPSSGIPLRT